MYDKIQLEEVEECQKNDQEVVSKIKSLQHDDEKKMGKYFLSFDYVYSNDLFEENPHLSCINEFDLDDGKLDVDLRHVLVDDM